MTMRGWVWMIVLGGSLGLPVAGQCEVGPIEPQAPAVAGSGFGTSVDMLDELVLIGVPGGTHPAYGAGVGTAELVSTVGQASVPVPFPPASTQLLLGAGARFGASVALSPGFAAVGAPGADNDSGFVVIYEQSGTTWTTFDVLESPTAAVDGEFGFAVNMSSDYLVVGEPGFDEDRGAVHVYIRNGGAYAHDVTITGLDVLGAAEVGDRFGEAVGISVGAFQQRLIVGAPGVYDDAGISCTFRRSGPGNWPLSNVWAIYLGESGDRLGAAVAIQGSWSITGAPGVDGYLGDDAGTVLIEHQSGGSFEVGGVLFSPEPGRRFGSSVALSGGLILIGSPGYRPPGGASETTGGATLVRAISNGPYIALEPIQDVFFPLDDGQPDDGFGTAVALGAGRAVVAAPFRDTALPETGVLHLYDTGSEAWSWTDIGGWLTGSDLVVLRGAGELCGGDAARVTVAGAPPGTYGVLAMSTLWAAVPFAGGTLIPDVGTGSLRLLGADATGHGELRGTWPANTPSGVHVYLQAWFEDVGGPQGFTASNGLVATAP